MKTINDSLKKLINQWRRPESVFFAKQKSRRENYVKGFINVKDQSHGKIVLAKKKKIQKMYNQTNKLIK